MMLYDILIFLTLLRLVKSEHLIGYDCLEPSTNITAVGLDFTKSCNILDHSPQYESVYVQVLQTKQKSDITISSCLVIKSYFMTYCGMHSHNSLVVDGFGNREIVPIKELECKTLQTEGYISFNGFRIEGIRPNSLQSRQIVDVGRFDTSGNCEGGSISMKGRWYTNVARQTNYEFLITSHTGSLDIETSNVITSNGYRYPYLDGTGFDPQLGYLFWSHPTASDTCTDKEYIVLYEGSGMMAVSENKGKTLIVNTTSFVFAIEMRRPNILCGSHGYITEHPKLLILTGTPTSFTLKTSALGSADIDQFLYVNSKFVYMERHFQGQLDSLYKNLISRICDLKHNQLKQLSSLAYIDPEVFAWAYTGKPGVTALMAGEVVYLMQCKPKSMTFRPVERCYLEIPVNNSGVIGFLRPRTRIFLRYGNEIPCNPLTPSMFKMGLHWVQLSPHPTEVKDPNALSHDDTESWTYTPSKHLLTAGLYPSNILLDYSSRLLYPMERSAIQNVLGATSIGQDVDIQNINLKGFVTSSFVDQIEVTASEKVWGWYNTLIKHTSGFVGIYIIIRLVLWAIAFLLNCRVLYDIFGFSVHLLGAFWGVLTKHIMFDYLRKRNQGSPPDSNIVLNHMVTTLSDAKKHLDEEETVSLMIDDNNSKPPRRPDQMGLYPQLTPDKS